MKFSFADDAEEAAFMRELRAQLGITGAQLQNEWHWVVAKGPRMEAYLVPRGVSSSLERLLKARMPYSLGLFAGGVQGRRLHVSLELTTHFANLLPARKVVILKAEAEQPVLYGRDVLAGSIQHVDATVRKGELVVLANRVREILALGKMLIEASDIKHEASTRRVVRNLIDKGWYLRKGG